MSDTAGGQPAGRRREMILASASKLFSLRGYTSTGIDEIGAASGITGPGVYRHFDNKREVLSEVAQRAVDRLLERVARVLVEATDDWSVLEGLVRNTIRSVLDDQESWIVTTREHRHLTPDALERVAGAYGHYMRLWARALSGARPELSTTEVRVIVRCVSSFTAPMGSNVELPRSRVEDLLASAAMAALRGTGPVHLSA